MGPGGGSNAGLWQPRQPTRRSGSVLPQAGHTRRLWALTLQATHYAMPDLRNTQAISVRTPWKF